MYPFYPNFDPWYYGYYYHHRHHRHRHYDCYNYCHCDRWYDYDKYFMLKLIDSYRVPRF